MKNTFKKTFALGLIILGITGCGANTDNLDILNSTNLPLLKSYLTSGSFSNATSSFTATNTHWTFNSGTTFYAPARGIVGEIGASAIVSGTSYVTIIHSGRVATRIHGIVSFSARSGDSVTAGQVLGTNLGSNTAFQVFVDGVASCPVSFIDPTLRSGLATNPCL